MEKSLLQDGDEYNEESINTGDSGLNPTDVCKTRRTESNLADLIRHLRDHSCMVFHRDMHTCHLYPVT